MYALSFILNEIWLYIRSLIQVKQKTDLELKDAYPFEEFNTLCMETIYSTENSLKRGICYGSNINDFVGYVKAVADALHGDMYYNTDTLRQRRGMYYVRDLFIDENGKVINPVIGIGHLKNQALRLKQGLEYRSKFPDLGVNTYNNLLTTEWVMKDLDDFFQEVDYDYRCLRHDQTSGSQ